MDGGKRNPKRSNAELEGQDDSATAQSEYGQHMLTKRMRNTTVPAPTSIIFAMKQRLGALQDALGVFKAAGVNLKHIESRVSKTNESDFEFYVSTDSSEKEIAVAVEKLRSMTIRLKVLDQNPSSDNPEWFPCCIQELDMFATRVLDAGTDINSDHPGFTDPVYRSRRAYFAKIAIEYKHGTPIPHVEYTADEVKTWGTIFKSLVKLHPTHACDEYVRVFPLLQEHCGFREDNIPQLEDISNFLQRSTGFRLRPVAGLLSSRDFLAGLAFRVFHSTQYIRHSSKPLYTPEPDVCHELLGHVPLFADRGFAEFSQEIGLASLGASEEDVKKLATCYWFTVEFGICRQANGLRAFGAGLLSSFGELEYCLSDKPALKPFEPSVTGTQEYPITEYQPLYFVAESFESAKEKMREFARGMDRPFSVQYDPYTEGINVLDTKEEMEFLAQSAKANMEALCAVIARRK